jgi:hypothetical protein
MKIQARQSHIASSSRQMQSSSSQREQVYTKAPASSAAASSAQRVVERAASSRESAARNSSASSSAPAAATATPTRKKAVLPVLHDRVEDHEGDHEGDHEEEHEEKVADLVLGDAHVSLKDTKAYGALRFRFKCPFCSFGYSIPYKIGGKRAQCKTTAGSGGCGRLIQVTFPDRYAALSALSRDAAVQAAASIAAAYTSSSSSSTADTTTKSTAAAAPMTVVDAPASSSSSSRRGVKGAASSRESSTSNSSSAAVDALTAANSSGNTAIDAAPGGAVEALPTAAPLPSTHLKFDCPTCEKPLRTATRSLTHGSAVSCRHCSDFFSIPATAMEYTEADKKREEMERQLDPDGETLLTCPAGAHSNQMWVANKHIGTTLHFKFPTCGCVLDCSRIFSTRAARRKVKAAPHMSAPQRAAHLLRIVTGRKRNLRARTEAFLSVYPKVNANEALRRALYLDSRGEETRYVASISPRHSYKFTRIPDDPPLRFDIDGDGVVDLLLEHKADINQRVQGNFSLLMQACSAKGDTSTFLCVCVCVYVCVCVCERNIIHMCMYVCIRTHV